MLQLDVLSSLAICGVGALVGAALLRPSLSQDAAGAEALQLSRGGFALIGAALSLPVVLDQPLPLWSQAAGAFGAAGGVIVLGWAMAALAGAAASRSAMWVALAAVLAAVLAALPAGIQGQTVVCALGMAAGSALMAWHGRRLIWHPRDQHERLLSVVIVLMVASSALRVVYLLTWNGPYEQHLLHLPPIMVTPFTLVYGVLPVVYAMLLHNVINARLLARLHKRAMTDQLTGSLSRHALAEGASPLIVHVREGGARLAVIMVDLDHFKRVNDQHGHTSGDAVLRHVAQVLQAQLRGEALLARFGGEEFVALVPVPSLPVARSVAERLRQGLEEVRWPGVVPGLATVTASLGVTLLGSDESLELALARADDALYRAKNGGRNQVQVGLAAA